MGIFCWDLIAIIKQMDATFLAIIFIFGSVIGSFLNVVVYRYNTNITFFGRSFCLYCAKELKWYEMLPIISFIFLRGRCASCKSRLSMQYPLVELSTAIAFLSSYLYAFKLYYGTDLVYFTLLLFVAFSLLIVISAYDLRHKIIPDGLVFSFILFALIRATIFPHIGESSLSALIAGPILALPFALLYFVSGGRWMGFGDAKLALGMGWLLGLAGGIAAVILSFWLGAIVSIFLLFLKLKKFTVKSEIPFAPFLVIGTFITLLLPIYKIFPFLYLIK